MGGVKFNLSFLMSVSVCSALSLSLSLSLSLRKVLKQIAVTELQPDETVDAVREARLLAKVSVCRINHQLPPETERERERKRERERERETYDIVYVLSMSPQLDHPSIVKFHDSFMDKDFFCIITEFCEVGGCGRSGVHVHVIYI